MFETAIIGGGVVGLSLAYALAKRGRQVVVLDRGPIGGEASWAGAGILPPANAATATTAEEQLAAFSVELHARWAEELRVATSIDNGYRRCGGLYVFNASRQGVLDGEVADLLRRQIAIEPVSRNAIIELEPALAMSDARRVAGGYVLPDEAQLRNPWHLRALAAACRQHGVELRPASVCQDMVIAGGRLKAVLTDGGALAADDYCFTTGAWTGELLRRCGCDVPVSPLRGQIVLLRCPTPPLRRIVNEGRRYLVPRDDGRVLVGSTEEDAGFDKRTTSAGVQGLLQLAVELAPPLAGAEVERTWAGLRPRTPDGLPLLGRLPGLDNAFVAAGHARAGLLLSTGTADVMCRLMLGDGTDCERPAIDLAPFRPDRFTY